jgi:hypothetical protein
MPRHGPRYTEQQAREAIAASLSYTEALRRLGMRPAGGNHRTIRRYVEDVWRIPTDHFNPNAARRPIRRDPIPLSEVLVTGSTYQRRALKERLFQAGIKARRCELCGQGELWHGRRMSLILDHVNGIADDNRLFNLRIVCANCNATLDTHCGRNLRRPPAERVRALRRSLHPSARPAAVLLVRVRPACATSPRLSAGHAPGPAAAVRAARRRDRGVERPRRRPPLRGLGQRDSQMAARLRGGGAS